MKKILYTAMSIVLVGVSASAQNVVMNEKFVDNTFVQVGGGFNTLYHQKYGNTNVSTGIVPAIEFGIGKWITPVFGIRAGIEAGRMSTMSRGYTASYIHADALINANNLFAGYMPGRFWNISPYLHFGLLNSELPAPYDFNGHELAAGFGLFNTFRITDRLGAYLDIRPMFFKQDVPFISNPSSVMPVLAGFMYNFGRTQWGVSNTVRGAGEEKDGEKMEGYVSGRFTDNTFIFAGAGINSLMRKSDPLVNFEVGLGKWINPLFGVRVAFQGLKQKNNGAEKKMFYGHGDLMLNMNNLIGGYSNSRFWNISPYVSAGWMLSGHNEVAAGAGLFNTFRILGDLSAYVDVHADVAQGRLYGGGGGILWGYSALAGLYYEFGGQYWNRRELKVVRTAGDRKTNDDASKAGVLGIVSNDGFADNAFIQIGAGANMLYKMKYGNNAFSNRLGAVLDVAVGKWLDPYFGLRGGLLAGYMAPYSASNYFSTYFHVDALLNANNIFGGYRPVRFWNIAPYAHFGLLSSNLSDVTAHEFAGGFGFLNTFRLSETFGLYLDIRPSFFKQDIPVGLSNPTSQLAATFGLVSNFGRTEWGTVKRGAVRGAIDETDGDMTTGIVYNRFIDNTFVQIGGGVSGLVNGKGTAMPHGEIAIGKWVNKVIGARFGFEGFNMKCDSKNTKYMYLHGDLLFNMNNLIAGYDPQRVWSISPYVSAGFAHAAFNEPTASAGLYNTFRISPDLGAYLDVRATASQARLYGFAGHPFINVSALAGLYFNLGGNGGWTNQTLRIERPRGIRSGSQAVPGSQTGTQFGSMSVSGSRPGDIVSNERFIDNTFVQIGAGVNMLYKMKYDNNAFSHGFGLALDVAAGKWLDPYFGLRGGLTAGHMAPNNASKYFSTYLHVDALLNANNIFGGYRPVRFWTIAPYAHFGLLSSNLPDITAHEFAGGFGFLNTFRISETFGLYLDLRPSFFKQDIPVGLSNPTSQLAATFGLVSNFGRTEWGTVKRGAVRGAIDETDGDMTTGIVYNRFIDNTFIQLGGGVSGLVNGKGAVSPHGEIAIGKWVNKVIGARFGFEGFNMKCDSKNTKYMYLHGDLLFNMNNLIAGYDPQRVWTVSPYVSAGFAHAAFNEPTASAGLYNTFRISPDLGAYLDVRATASHARLYNYAGHPFINVSALAGFYFNLGGNGGWTNQTLRIERPAGAQPGSQPGDIVSNERFIDNTFVTVGGGVNSLNNIKYTGTSVSGNVGPIIDITLGKWISPVFGLRLGVAAGQEAPATGGKFGSSYLHGDALLNLNNMFGGYRPGRIWNMSAYMHAGLYTAELPAGYGLSRAHELTSGVGLLNTFNITDRVALFLDLRESFNKQNVPAYTSRPTSQLSATAGLAYNFGRTEWGSVKTGTVHGGIHETDGDLTDGIRYNKFFSNTFWQAAAGVSSYFGNGRPTFNLDFNLGKWITPSLGVRVGGQGWKEYVGNNSKTVLALHSDLLLNVNNLFGGYKPERVWSAIPYVSAGVSHSTFNEVTLGAGLINSFRLTERVAAYIDLRANGVNGRLVNQDGRFYSYSAFGGLTVNFGSDRFTPATLKLIVPSRTKESESIEYKADFLNNTFVSIAGGFNLLAANRQGIGLNARVAPAMDLSLGKWFSPRFGARIGVLGANMSQWGKGELINENILVTEKTVKNNLDVYAQEASFAYIHGDFLWNCTNSFGGYNPARKYSLKPYAHVGYLLMNSWGGLRSVQYERELVGGFGLINSYRLADRVSFNLDLRGTFAHSDYLIQKVDGLSLLGSAMIGFTYDIGHQDFVLTGKSFYEPAEQKSSFFDNTFVSVGAGLNYQPTTTSGVNGAGAAVDVAFGKWITPSVGTRLGYHGINMTGSTTWSSGHLDILWNPWNTFAKEKKFRTYEGIPYLHGGLARSNDFTSREFVAGAGWNNVLRLGGGVSANLDLRASIFAGHKIHNFVGRSIMLTAMAGLSYDIHTNSWRDEIVRYREDDENGNVARNWAISTNVLDYADMGTINFEVQYGLGRHWSADAQVRENSWNFSGRMNQRQTVAIGAKYWPWYLYSGIWFRGTTQFERYRQADKFLNFGTSNAYEQGDKYGAGLSLGYSLMVKTWFNIDFGVGLWGGYKNFVQYKDAGFTVPALSGNKISQGKFFFEPNEISVSAMFVF